MAMELFRMADSLGVGGNFYVNRKLLIPQTLSQMQKIGLWSGVRAAEYDDLYQEDAPFQVTSCQSEDARCYKSSTWDLHHVGDGGIVIVDEAHMQKSKVMKNILGWYRRQNARIILLTATPVAMGGWADELLVSASLREWRDAGALVMVQPTTVSQPDMRKVKRNATGEYVLDGEKKKVYMQSIVGDVVSSYEKSHETGPTMVYCPGVSESVWMVRKFRERGHRFIHVDATSAEIDGVRHSLTRELWAEIVEMVKAGEAAGLSSRFKLREGVDIPQATHCILATPIGSLASYLQIVGRVMRAYSCDGYTKTHAILQDHGGVYHSQGSPNQDRDWDSLWQMKEHAASSFHMDQLREGAVKESIRCPNCGAERAAGPKCWKCGFEHPLSERRIIEENGALRQVTGDIVPRTRRVRRHDTAQLWTKMFYGYRNKKVEQSFAQMEAFFYRTHGYRPTRDLPFMPRHAIDWKAKVYEVPMEKLTGI
jgi:superfamily II DNA or RNA helicase